MTRQRFAAVSTKTGLTVRCELDTNTYEKAIVVSDAEMAALNIEGDLFHPEWNYTIKPRPRETYFAESPMYGNRRKSARRV